jgi:putative transposase
VRRAYKFRAYPTVSQEGRAVRLLRDHCDLYNAALEERRDAWRRRNVSVGFNDQCAQLKEIRKNDPMGQGRHSCTAQQQTLRRLDATFRAFFRRAKAKRHRVGYPRFKPYQRFDQVRFVAGDGAKWMPAGAGRWARASFQAVGHLKVRQHRPVNGRVKTLQLKRECRRWYVIVVIEADAEPLPPSGRTAGVDVGVARFLTTSDGVVVANPRFLDSAQWRKVRNQRRDFHHMTARALVDTCDVLALEDLHIGGLTASARGTAEEPGRNLAHKAGLNRSILDAGWGQFTSILVAKAESAGRRVVRVEPGYTSLDCHACGSGCARPRQDIVICPNCGEQDADRNGACNIATRAALGSSQAHVA